MIKRIAKILIFCLFFLAGLLSGSNLDIQSGAEWIYNNTKPMDFVSISTLGLVLYLRIEYTISIRKQKAERAEFKAFLDERLEITKLKSDAHQETAKEAKNISLETKRTMKEVEVQIIGILSELKVIKELFVRTVDFMVTGKVKG